MSDVAGVCGRHHFLACDSVILDTSQTLKVQRDARRRQARYGTHSRACFHVNLIEVVLSTLTTKSFSSSVPTTVGEQHITQVQISLQSFKRAS